MPETTHEGNDPMGAPSTHRGRLEDCPAPDCQDRIIEQHLEADPWHGDPRAYPQEADLGRKEP